MAVERRDTDTLMKELRGAADRLLRGEPIRSDGRLNVAALMAEAGIARVYAYRAPYSEVVEWFKRQADLSGRKPPTKAPTGADAGKVQEDADQIATLKKDLAEAKAMNDRLSSQVAYLSEAVRQLEETIATQRVVVPLRGKEK